MYHSGANIVPWVIRNNNNIITTILNTRQGHNDRVREGQSKRIWGAGLARDLCRRAAEILSFEHFLEGLKRRWWPDIGWQVIPDQRCSGVKCKRAEFSFGGWLYQEIWAGRMKLSSWFVVAQQRGQIRWCACAENFVCESSYFELDPRCHWKPVKFIEQWFLLKRFVRKTTRANRFCWRWSLAVRDFDMPYMIELA